jgi:ankyrin repeat protein
LTEICQASAAGDVFTLRRLVNAGVDVNSYDYDKRSVLHIAASKGNVHSIEFLLHKGATPNFCDSFNITPLFDAVRSGHTEAAEVLFKAGGTLGLVDDHESKARNTFLTRKQSQKIESDIKDAGSLMCLVATRADVFYLERLLNFGLSPRCCDYDGRTGLHLAAYLGHTQILECLLRHGAHPSPIDNFGRTPLLEAILASEEPSARILYNAGGELGFLEHSVVSENAEEKIVGKDGKLIYRGVYNAIGRAVNPRSRIRAYHMLVQTIYDRNIARLRLLLRFGCSVNVSDYNKETPAHICCAENFVQEALILLEYGADFHSESSKSLLGQTPLDEARSHNNHKLVDVIQNLIELKEENQKVVE